jgi:hypothetical protein
MIRDAFRRATRRFGRLAPILIALAAFLMPARPSWAQG